MEHTFTPSELLAIREGLQILAYEYIDGRRTSDLGACKLLTKLNRTVDNGNNWHSGAF